MRAAIGLVAMGLAACGGGDCVALVDGEWSVDGSAFGMPMTGSVTMDVDKCSFTIGEWNMAMNSLPTGGTIDGDQITFDGDDFWKTCSGTVSSDGMAVTGACEDGSELTMTAGALTTTGTMTGMM